MNIAILRGALHDVHFWRTFDHDIGDFPMKKLNQISVPLPDELREFVRITAAREDRSEAGVIRRLVAEAARKSQQHEQVAA